MSKVTKRLGRGLDSLVSDLRGGQGPPPARPIAAKETLSTPDAGREGRAALVEVSALAPNPFQPRSSVTDEDVRSLAVSLRECGMIQPITVRSTRDGLQIIAGERRWRAASVAGLTRVPVLIRDADDRAMLEIALVENIQREDLNAIDRARAYRRFCREFSVTSEQLADRLGEDRTTVTNYLRLLDLPQEIQDLVRAGRLSMGHARCIAGVVDDQARQRLARTVVAHELSVRALEEIVRREKRGRRRGANGAPPAPERSAHLRDLEHRLALAIGTKVTIQEGRSKGTGRLVIEYYSLDDFERITDHLGLTPE